MTTLAPRQHGNKNRTRYVTVGPRDPCSLAITLATKIKYKLRLLAYTVTVGQTPKYIAHFHWLSQDFVFGGINLTKFYPVIACYISKD